MVCNATAGLSMFPGTSYLFQPPAQNSLDLHIHHLACVDGVVYGVCFFGYWSLCIELLLRKCSQTFRIAIGVFPCALHFPSAIPSCGT